MRANADVPPQIDLAALVRASPGDVTTSSQGDITTYVNSPAFPAYMESGNRVRALVEAIYQSINADMMALVIRRDKRDVVHSVAYLKAFRQAIGDNRSEMALKILAETKYPFDLLADALQQDRNSVNILRRKEKSCAYLSVMKQFERLCHNTKKRVDAAFFDDFCAYMIVSYTSGNDLVSNLVAADSPRFLMYVADLDSDFGVRVLNEYIRRKYEDERENIEEDNADLIRAVGRLSNERRGQVVWYLRSGVVRKEDLEDMLEHRVEWERIRDGETRRNGFLQACRTAMLAANARGIYTRKDVIDLAEKVASAGKTAAVDATMSEFVTGLVGSRYRYLPEK